MNALHGRARELEILRAYYQRALERDQQLVLVEGDAGIGKTALLAAFMAGAARPWLRGARIFSLRAPTGVEYQPVHHAALAATSRRLYRKLVGTRQASESARGMLIDWLSVIPIWGDLLNAIAGTLDILQRRRRERAFAAIDTADEEIAALISASHRRPLVLLMDDLERAGTMAVARLQALIEAADEGSRILIVGAYRPTAPGVVDPPIHRLRQNLPGKREFFRHLRLEGLDESGVADWVRAAFPGATPSKPFLDWLYAATGGHPGNLEASIAHLTASGAAYQESGAWRLPDDPSGLSLPIFADSFADLGGFSAEVATALRAASALGEQFDTVSLSQLLARDELAVEDDLALGVRYGVLQNLGERTLPDGEITTAFRFASPHLRAALRAPARHGS